MKKLAVVYWTGTGNTENMAKAIIEGANSVGTENDLYFSDDFNANMIDDYEVIAFGCPAMGNEELEDSFEDLFESCEDKLPNKKVALFGSYEWNNGEWMEEWTERTKNLGAILVTESLAVYDNPSGKDLERCRDFGIACANS